MSTATLCSLTCCVTIFRENGHVLWWQEKYPLDDIVPHSPLTNRRPETYSMRTVMESNQLVLNAHFLKPGCWKQFISKVSFNHSPKIMIIYHDQKRTDVFGGIDSEQSRRFYLDIGDMSTVTVFISLLSQLSALEKQGATIIGK